jgi:hypothetical protein
MPTRKFTAQDRSRAKAACDAHGLFRPDDTRLRPPHHAGRCEDVVLHVPRERHSPATLDDRAVPDARWPTHARR